MKAFLPSVVWDRSLFRERTPILVILLSSVVKNLVGDSSLGWDS